MTTTSGESVTDTDIAMAITVHVGAITAGAAVGRMTTSNDSRSARGVESIVIQRMLASKVPM
ncbi:hypothetical protein AC629_38720 [Bradyrhizobium sp. NAS80.1]|nr:hypothetical protein AC629_38720 [Bradyrhizobium sp. NAS80.1]